MTLIGGLLTPFLFDKHPYFIDNLAKLPSCRLGSSMHAFGGLPVWVIGYFDIIRG
jgi:hypothetical protein